MANKVVAVLDPYHQAAIDLLKAAPSLDVILPGDKRIQEWHTLADGILMRSETNITAEDFQKSRLKAVVKQGVGINNVDVESARTHGVAVHNTPGLNSETVAELALALTLSLSRRVTELDRRIRSGDTVIRSQFLGGSLFRKTVGIVGMGNIGRAVARKWIGACEANLVAFDPMAPENAWHDLPHRRVTDLDELLAVADVVTLHVPLTPGTAGMIGAKQLSLMKEGAILVNTARGGIVDEPALVKELKMGRLRGAVLDALEKEPPTKDNYKELLDLENVIVTPHVGASTVENQIESGKAAATTLIALLDGKKDVSGKVI